MENLIPLNSISFYDESDVIKLLLKELESDDGYLYDEEINEQIYIWDIVIEFILPDFCVDGSIQRVYDTDQHIDDEYYPGTILNKIFHGWNEVWKKLSDAVENNEVWVRF